MKKTSLNQSHEIHEIVLRDIDYCIERANSGQLSPYWQEYARREIESEFWAINTDQAMLTSLSNRLEVAIASKQQISNYELAAAEISSFDGKYEYYYDSSDYGTMMEIIYAPHAASKYSADAYINKSAYEVDPKGYISAMRSDITAWAKSRGYSMPAGERLSSPDEFIEKVHFDSIPDVLQYLGTVLSNPECALI